jgi:hypothetical protein
LADFSSVSHHLFAGSQVAIGEASGQNSALSENIIGLENDLA